MIDRWRVPSAVLTLVVAAVMACTVQAAPQLSPADDQGRYVFMIEFAEPGLLEVHRSQRGTAAGFDFHSPQMLSAREALQAQQAMHLSDMAKVLRRSVQPSHYYLVSHSGIAVRLTPEESRQVAALPGVARIQRERVYELDTYRGPEFIGADAIWTGAGSPGGTPYDGSGMVAAILDTGIHLGDHPSFVNDPSCGHGDTLPDKLLSAVDCGSTDGTGMCNGSSPQDWQNHGSHVAGTVAGNVVTTADTPPPNTPPPFDEISGVAPCASIRSYMVCPSSCPGSYIQAGMDSVLIHGDVDVMNFSISGGQSPWLDNDRRKLDLVDAGIFVAASAGNTSTGQPNPVGQVNHRGPWVMSVAASTHDAIIANDVSLDGGPTDMAGLQGTGPAITTDYTGQLRFSGDVDPGNVEGCSAFPGGAFTGEAALIPRGTCAFADKVNNAVAAGANFVIVYNNTAGPPIVMGGLEATSVSSVMVDDVAGAALVAALDGGTEEVTVGASAAGFIMPDYGDILAGFSFRGPTPSPLHNLQKPDITAPGVNIYAAGRSGVEYTFMSGTSMSGPHAAGAGLLVAQANPDWTPTEVKSAMKMTASKSGTKDTGTAPWDWDDVGSGRVDLNDAALAGLVMNETTANFLAANPATGGDVRTLNLPAVREMDCSPVCSWTRTVRNTLGSASSWTVTGSGINADMQIDVSPSTFSFTGDTNETQELTITVAPLEDLTTSIGFGEIVLSEDASQSPDLHITVAISGEPGLIGAEIVTDPDSFNFVLNPDTTSSQALTISNIGTEPLEWSIETEEVATMASGLLGFVGDFDIDNWELVNTPAGVNGSFNTNDGPPIELFVIGGNDGTGGDTDFQIEVPATGTIHFDWGYQSGDTACWDSGGYAINGVYTELACNDSPVPYFDESESVSVSEGDLFAFRVWTDDGLFGAGELGVTNFAFDPAVCNDPATLPWLSVSPDSGTTAVDASDMVDVNIDTTGLAEGLYEAHLCITSNDPNNPLVALPVSVTVMEGTIEPPTIDVDPTSFSFSVITGESDEDTLTISNQGDEQLNWVIDTAEIDAGLFGHDPALDEVLEVPDFTVVTPANGGTPQMFTIPGGVTSSGAVLGFSFEGTVTGPGGTGTWASDMCMIVESPDGSVYGVGGISGTNPNCNVNNWDFQGSGSTNDGTYSSEHDNVFSPGVGDAGDWTLTFIHDWNSTSAADMAWTDVTVTLHKFIDATGCDAPTDIPWLSVSPAAGSNSGGTSAEVTVSVDSSGLSSGFYEAQLCVSSNDPADPLVEIPVELTVIGDAEIDVDPESISMTLSSGDSGTETLTISNLGEIDLVWNIETGNVPTGNWRAHFPATPYLASPGPIGGTSWLADTAAGQGTGSSSGVLPLGMAVPAYSTTGFTAEGYITMDAANPASLSVITASQPTNFYGGAFIANDFEQHYVLASAGGNQPENTFGVIDTATGAFTSLGLVTGGGTGTWTSMSWDHSTGTLFATRVPGAGSNNLYTIDPDTLEADLVGSISGGGLGGGAIIIAIAISPEGLMYGIDIDSNTLVAIDKTNGDAAAIGPLGVNPSFAQDMDFDPTDGTLYWAGYLGGGNSQIYTVNTETGAATSLGNVPNGNELLNFTIALPGGAATCGDPAEVPWLSVDVESGTTPSGQSSEVVVTLDADGLGFGTYEALLCVFSNDPVNPLVEVPVTLEVPPGANDAILEGTVSSLGYCSDDPFLAAGASIEVEGDLGGTYFATADANGFYSLVIDDSESPVTVTASAPDHITDVATGVVLVGQQTTVVDFDLVLEAACATVDPESIEDSVSASGIGNYTLTIGNIDGAAELNWSIELDQAESAGLWPFGQIAYQYGLAGGDVLEPVTGFDRASGEVDSGRGDNPHLVMPGLQGAPIDTDLEEGFEDITTLPGAGWSLQNQSEPLGSTDWFQGNPGVFVAHEGPDDSYIGANFNNTTGGTGIISNWLITPEVVLHNGTELRFWTRTGTGSSWPDRLEVRLSTSGDSVDVGSGANDVGDFDTLLVSINENLTVGGYPEVWTEVVIEVEGLSGATSGRFGLRYFVTDAGPTGANSNYIGIDTLSITQPESTACANPEGVAWLSVDSTSGTTAAGASSNVAVTVDGTELEEGTNEAFICVSTDDAQASLLVVPVTIERLELDPPVIGVDPLSLSATLAEGETDVQSVSISNSGEATLNWSVDTSGACELPGWASFDPASGSVDEGDTDTLEVTFDATGLADGEYDATLCIASNDPASPLVEVDLSLTVADATATVEGTVLSLGYCADNPTAAAGAGIIVQGQTDSWTTTTDANGFYQVAIPAEEGPVDVTATMVDHLSATATGVELTAGEVVTVDLDLQLEAACATVNPASVEFTLQADQAADAGLVIGNLDGAAALTWWLGTGAGCYDGGDAWLSLDSVGDKVAAGAAQTVTVTADSSGLDAGSYETSLCIETTDDQQPLITVPVTLLVQDERIFHDRFEAAD
jgi:hypothetical protein